MAVSNSAIYLKRCFRFRRRIAATLFLAQSIRQPPALFCLQSSGVPFSIFLVCSRARQMRFFKDTGQCCCLVAASSWGYHEKRSVGQFLDLENCGIRQLRERHIGKAVMLLLKRNEGSRGP